MLCYDLPETNLMQISAMDNFRNALLCYLVSYTKFVETRNVDTSKTTRWAENSCREYITHSIRAKRENEIVEFLGSLQEKEMLFLDPIISPLIDFMKWLPNTSDLNVLARNRGFCGRISKTIGRRATNIAFHDDANRSSILEAVKKVSARIETMITEIKALQKRPARF